MPSCSEESKACATGCVSGLATAALAAVSAPPAVAAMAPSVPPVVSAAVAATVACPTACVAGRALGHIAFGRGADVPAIQLAPPGRPAVTDTHVQALQARQQPQTVGVTR